MAYFSGDARQPNDQGFDVSVAGSFWGRPLKGFFSPYQMPNLEDGPKGEYLPDRLTSEAIQIMDDFSKKGQSVVALHELLHRSRSLSQQAGEDRKSTPREGVIEKPRLLRDGGIAG